MNPGLVTFDWETWVAMFPEFSGVSEAAATLYFNMATIYINNGCCTPIKNINTLSTLLYLTTSHIAKLFSAQANGAGGGTGQAPSPLVGRIASATEGSVTVSAEMPQQQPNAEWWNQTPYGAAVWVAMKPFRLFRYMGPTKRRIYNPPVGLWGWGI